MNHVTEPDRVRPPLWILAAPAVFVVLWSTGFIGAKLGLPYAPPFTFLVLRFAIAAVLLAAVAAVAGAPWPRTWADVGNAALVGVLIHAVYIGGVFSAIHRGMPAGVASLIVGLQPVLTAVLARPYLGERVTAKQWAGLVIGLAGVILVVANKLQFEQGHIVGVLFTLGSLLGITIATLHQKRHGAGMDLRSGAAIQFAAATIAMAIPALLFETMTVQWTGEFIFALGWLVLVLSLGAVTLLYGIIRRGAAAKVASLFYLVPPVTALIAYFLFGETLGPMAIAGMAMAVAGVALVTRS
ncbi:MAG: EamA family transporter [Rhodospirillales bacterium]|nr:EamA family transporter [Rhodospirillales bacterium]